MSPGWKKASTVTGIAAVIWLLVWRPSLSIPEIGAERLMEKLLDYGAWAALVSGSLTVLQAVIAPIPGNVITIANGLMFGPVLGGLLSWSATLAGACLCFGLSRKIGKPFAQRMAGTSLRKAEHFFKRYGMHAVFLIRIMPFVPFDAVSYAAGIVGIPFSRFVLGTAVGIIPSIIVYSTIGPVLFSDQWWILPLGLCATAVMAAVFMALVNRMPLAMSAETEQISGD